MELVFLRTFLLAGLPDDSWILRAASPSFPSLPTLSLADVHEESPFQRLVEPLL